MNLNIEESDVEIDDSKFQLNLNISALDDDFADVFTQKLWNQAEARNIFEFRILKALRNGDRYHNKIPLVECEERNNTLYFRDKKYVFNSNSFRLRIIQLAHDSVTSEHSKRAKTYELVSRVYWWLNLYKYIKRFVRNCHVCTRAKSFRQKTQEWLRFLSVSQRRWRDVSMNYVDPLLSNIFMKIIYRYILVFVDRFIKMKHLILIVIMKAKEAAQVFYVNVWKYHDLSEFLTFDRDIQFIFDVFKHLCQMLKIDVRLSIAYHPETDEQTKRFNAVVKHYLRAFCNYMQNDWTKWLFDAKFFVNNASFVNTLASPFLANYEQNFRLNFEFLVSLSIDLIAQSRAQLIDVENFVKKMKELIERLRDEMLVAQVIQKANANAHRRFNFRYLVDDQVWLNVKNFNTARFFVKLNDRHVDFFRVKRVFRNHLVVELKLSEFMKVHSVFHANFLSHVTTDFLLGQIQALRELVVAENDERAWYVNRVLNFKLDRRYISVLLKYYIDWEEHNPTWEPFNLVDNCQEALNDFHAVNLIRFESHVTPCTISRCQCNDP